MLIAAVFTCLMVNLVCFAVAPNVVTALFLGITVASFIVVLFAEYARSL